MLMRSGGQWQDFNWFAEQLATVSPSVRYRMDPKDCVSVAIALF
jgi:hypothetical protein